MDYKRTAQEIYEKVGGKENLVSATHCATRLRLVLADNAKCDAKAVEDIDGVKGVFSASGQLQIILGTGTVNKVYDEFIAISGLTAATKEEVKAAAAAKQNIFKRAIKTLGDIFVPIIPAIVASGFLMGIMEALNFMVNNGFLNIDTSGSIYVFANLFANTAYVFLPILIAYSAAKAFGGNPYLGAVIGMLMIHPDLQNAWTVATQGVLRTQSVWFGLYEVDLVGYQGHVIPVIIAVWVMCFIEKRLHKVVPAMLDLFVTPLVSVFVTGYLTYSIIGPIFVAIENSIIGGIQALLALPLGIGSLIMGGLYSTTVVAGIHHMYTVIDFGQISQFGVTYWLPLASAANMAQGAATLAVALKTKNGKTKSVALPSALSCFMGITEPAIFGVNLRHFKPFICGAVYAPVSGTVIPSEEIPDETFAAGVLGQGVGIQPAEGLVVAPFDGEISSVTDTRHAVGITSPDGMELLIHVGVDTVAMQGDGFACFVQEGQQVKAGDKLIAFDRDKIAAAGHPDVVVVLVTNSDDYESLAIQAGARKALDKIIQV